MLLRAMSSCFAMTSRSRESPPSGGGVSCAMAAPAARYVVDANDRIAAMQRASAQNRFFIECLFSSKLRRGGRGDRSNDRADLKPEAERGTGRGNTKGKAG